ncbi:MAG: IS110 family transposase [Actinomycetota bacterium]|nr:IS110 family transposase [Actinomycetota bacterium]
MDLQGVGPVVAARVLADVGDVTRFADRNRFASWTGTAPLEASSGEQNRAGNRRMNYMIHIAAISQIRLDTYGRIYYRRKRAEGKRAPRGDPVPQAQDLRRHLPPAPPGRLACRGRRRGHGSGRALQGDSRIQRGRPSPAHRHFGSATSRTRTEDATPDRLTTEGSRNDCEDRQRSLMVLGCGW